MGAISKPDIFDVGSLLSDKNLVIWEILKKWSFQRNENFLSMPGSTEILFFLCFWTWSWGQFMAPQAVSWHVLHQCSWAVPRLQSCVWGLEPKQRWNSVEEMGNCGLQAHAVCKDIHLDRNFCPCWEIIQRWMAVCSLLGLSRCSALTSTKEKVEDITAYGNMSKSIPKAIWDGRLLQISCNGEHMIFAVFPNNLLPKAFSLQFVVATTASRDSQHIRNMSWKLCLSFLEE